MMLIMMIMVMMMLMMMMTATTMMNHKQILSLINNLICDDSSRSFMYILSCSGPQLNWFMISNSRTSKITIWRCLTMLYRCAQKKFLKVSGLKVTEKCQGCRSGVK